MTERAFLPIATVRALEREAAQRHVSIVARSSRGFLQAYKDAGGDVRKLSPSWLAKRRAFLARHRAQAKQNREPWFLPSGAPTRRHLALAMWAWSPLSSKLEAYAYGRRAVGDGGALQVFYDRQIARALRRELRGEAIARPPNLVLHTYLPGEAWGGRFEPGGWPSVHLYPSSRPAMNRAILVHELAHWVRHHTGDPKGHHDYDFCRLLARMYAAAGVSPKVRGEVESAGGCRS